MIKMGQKSSAILKIGNEMETMWSIVASMYINLCNSSLHPRTWKTPQTDIIRKFFRVTTLLRSLTDTEVQCAKSFYRHWNIFICFRSLRTQHEKTSSWFNFLLVQEVPVSFSHSHNVLKRSCFSLFLFWVSHTVSETRSIARRKMYLFRAQETFQPDLTQISTDRKPQQSHTALLFTRRNMSSVICLLAPYLHLWLAHASPESQICFPLTHRWTHIQTWTCSFLSLSLCSSDLSRDLATCPSLSICFYASDMCI